MAHSGADRTLFDFLTMAAQAECVPEAVRPKPFTTVIAYLFELVPFRVSFQEDFDVVAIQLSWFAVISPQTSSKPLLH